jgi:hypothetical protein
MDASTEPQTPEEKAALRALAVTHYRRHRWIALCYGRSYHGFVSIDGKGHRR